MKPLIQSVAICVALSLAAASAAEQVPNLDELMKPYPNPAWNNSNVMATESFEIAPNLYSFFHRGTRSIFIVTDEGVIVADPVSVDHAKLLRDAIRAVTDQPVKYVVYSHSHWDHVLGGQIFKDEGAEFIVNLWKETTAVKQAI